MRRGKHAYRNRHYTQGTRLIGGVGWICLSGAPEACCARTALHLIAATTEEIEMSDLKTLTTSAGAPELETLLRDGRR